MSIGSIAMALRPQKRRRMRTVCRQRQTISQYWTMLEMMRSGCSSHSNWNPASCRFLYVNQSVLSEPRSRADALMLLVKMGRYASSPSPPPSSSPMSPSEIAAWFSKSRDRSEWFLCTSRDQSTGGGL